MSTEAPVIQEEDLPQLGSLPLIADMARADFSEANIPLIAGSAFADNMADNIQAAFKQVQYGLDHTAHVINVFQDISNREIQFQGEMDKFLNEEYKQPGDKMVTAHQAYISTLQSVQKITKQRKKLGQLIQLRIVTPMTTFLQQERIKLEAIRKSYLDYKEPIPRLLAECEVLKSKCAKSIPVDDKASLFKKSVKWVKVLELCRAFDERRNYSNQYLHSYFEQQLPQILTSLQRIEERRLAAMVNVFDLLSTSMSETVAAVDNYSSRMQDIAESVDIVGDIEEFVLLANDNMIENNIRAQSKVDKELKSSSSNPMEVDLIQVIPHSSIPKYLPYDLNLSVVEIEKRAIMETSKKTKTPPIDISDTPERIVEQQAKIFPEMRSLTMPRIFLALKKAVVDLGGLEKEGIFRISSDFSAIDQVYDKFRVADFDVEINDPFVAANCMKKWMRELKQSLVPQKLIDQVVQALDIAASDITTSQQKLKKVFEQLPSTNQLMIKGILRLMRDISFQDNLVHTKMSMPNLAVVFGPSFLRADDIADPMRALKLADSAQQLILMLVHIVDVKDYPSDQEITAAFPKVQPVKDASSWKHAPVSLNYIPSTTQPAMGSKNSPVTKNPNISPISELNASRSSKVDTSPKSTEKKRVGAIALPALSTEKSVVRERTAAMYDSKEMEMKVDEISDIPNIAMARKWSAHHMKVLQGTPPTIGSTNDDETDITSGVKENEKRLKTARLLVQLGPSNTENARSSEASDSSSGNVSGAPKKFNKKAMGVQLPTVGQTHIEIGVISRQDRMPSLRRTESVLIRVARCWKCQAKAVNPDYCVNCWSPLDPSKAQPIPQHRK